ncbi:hypothetical protein [Runella aurantiaca]|uniref:Uncharacterized protein n=1 Tax=Runella aurantiaca TaxID=2282308 RepID=A0A369I111_9BACT|nr:hypothetical protein [Runella aurantiaca]RDB03459.1 hypothetical protein DVG78_23365 [Runella aurantiaca]
MKQSIVDINNFYQAPEFSVCVSEATNESFDKIKQVLELSLECLSVCIAKQMTYSIGKQIATGKIMKAVVDSECFERLPTAEFLHEMSLKGDQMLAGMLPSQKSAIVGIIVGHTKVRTATASFLVGIMVYLLVAYIQKEAYTRKWDVQELSFFLYQLVDVDMTTQLNQKDLETLGVSSLFIKS